jgi:hypothetical protein
MRRSDGLEWVHSYCPHSILCVLDCKSYEVAVDQLAERHGRARAILERPPARTGVSAWQRFLTQTSFLYFGY